MKAATWVIPGERMKAGKPHIVPLSARAVLILKAIPRAGEYVFINGGGKSISNMAMLQLMKGMNANGVPHGFRSTFMDWAHDRTSYPKHVIDMALAHSIGGNEDGAGLPARRSASQAHQVDERMGAIL